MDRDRGHRRATVSLSALLAAHAISQTGNVVTAFAVPFYVLGLGGSGIEVGIAAFFATAPVVIGGALGGVVIYRVGHRRAAIVADIVSGAAVLAIPILALTVGLPFWALLMLVFAGGLLDTPGQTARRVILPNLTARAGIRLEQSVGLLDGSERFAKLMGASIAGLLVAVVGPIAALFVNAATFAVSAVLTGAINPILGTVQLERVPEHMRGRVFGLINAGSWAGVPFGALLGGIAADAIGLGLALAIIAMLYTLATLSPLTGGTWRQMERPQVTTPKSTTNRAAT